MMDGKALYQDLILDHGNTPRNQGPLETATHTATANNPLCGDRVSIHVHLDEGRAVVRATFEARGCLIARASASLLTEAVAGRDVAACLDLCAALEAVVGGEAAPLEDVLEPLRAVQQFPARRGCVSVAWHALHEALTSNG